jgi:hypothetical protein
MPPVLARGIGAPLAVCRRRSRLSLLILVFALAGLIACLPGCLIWPVHYSRDPRTPQKIVLESDAEDVAILNAEETSFEAWDIAGGLWHDLYVELFDREIDAEAFMFLADPQDCRLLTKVAEPGRAVFVGDERLLELPRDRFQAKNAAGLLCGSLVLALSNPSARCAWEGRPAFQRIDAYEKGSRRHLWGAVVPARILRVGIASNGVLLYTRDGWVVTIGPRTGHGVPTGEKGASP